MVERRDVWWMDLAGPGGSDSGSRRPLLIVQADPFNRSRLRTVLAIVLSSNTRLLDAPGNVLVPAAESGLSRDAVANVAQLVTVDRDYLGEKVGRISREVMERVDAGLRLVLAQ
ncbi:MAG: type II toxin-antitoxin system PemK/MazF family toxin [Gemmatimonadota bacterium]|nr:type II toxin-antitoxin system PemK/MazF family toxin [Gemmatimonadota bacterium]